MGDVLDHLLRLTVQDNPFDDTEMHLEVETASW